MEIQEFWHRKLNVKIDVPPFNRSAMDGYAVIADDVSKCIRN